jgi:aminoglycoside 6'-N-acetyltransferase I
LKPRHGLEIRAPDSADAQGLADLLSAAGIQLSLQAAADRLAVLKQQPGAALIAANWGPPVGLIILHWYRTIEVDQPIAQITSLLVAPDERRRGIGRLLIKAAAQAARTAGCSTLELLTAPDQPELLEFCSASGFIPAGQRLIRPLRKKP